jgi:hypothetical protein
VSTATLLDGLTAAGIRLRRDGDDLVADVLPGANLGSYREHIQADKFALLAELRLREEIVAAVDVEPANFDRSGYDELWRRWSELQAEELS